MPKCTECPNEFKIKQHPFRLTCSSTCKKHRVARLRKEIRDKKAKKQGVVRVCSECNSPFEVIDGRKKFTCGDECSAERRRRREREDPSRYVSSKLDGVVDRSKRINCLRCGDNFLSEDYVNNRLCDRCNGRINLFYDCGLAEGY